MNLRHGFDIYASIPLLDASNHCCSTVLQTLDKINVSLQLPRR